MSAEHLLNVKFVKIVEGYPCIWNTSLTGYRNKNLVTLAWNNISENINETVEVCRERWRNIRIAFIRSRKMRTSRHSSDSRSISISSRPYYLASYLGFVVPFLKESKLCEINSDTDDNRASEYGSEDDSKPGAFLDECESTNTVQNNAKTKPTIKRRISVNPEADIGDKVQPNNKEAFGLFDEADSPLPNEADSLLTKKRFKLNEDEDVIDSDMAFFKSLLRDVRKMNSRQNRKFRLKVLQVMDQIFDEDE